MNDKDILNVLRAAPKLELSAARKSRILARALELSAETHNGDDVPFATDPGFSTADAESFQLQTAARQLRIWRIAAIVAFVLLPLVPVPAYDAGHQEGLQKGLGDGKLAGAQLSELEWEPAGVKRSSNGDAAFLMRRDGRQLFGWQSVTDGIEDATFVRRDATRGQALAILGYASDPRTANPGTFMAYGVATGAAPEKRWELSVSDGDLPADARRILGPDIVGPQLSARVCRVLNVFPELQEPQLVCLFQHSTTLCVVLISDLDGRVRYAAVHDGNLRDAYMLPEQHLLVFVGLNGDAYRGERGLSPGKSHHPAVLLAIQPTLDDVAPKWIQTDTHAGVKPVFYRYVDNSAVFDHDTIVTFGDPDRSLKPGQFVGVIVHALKTPSGDATVILSVDATGHEIPQARQVSNTWKWEEKAGNLPSHRAIEIKELPPIQNRNAVPPSGVPATP